MKHASRLIAIIVLISTALSASAQDAPPASPAPPVAAPVAQAPAAPAVPQAPAPGQQQAPAAAVVQRREEQIIVTPPVATGTPPQRPSLLDRVRAFQHANGNAAQLLGQIQALTAERDQLASQVGTLTSERDGARHEIAQISAALDAQTNVVQATATQIATTVGIPQGALPAQISGDGGTHFDRWMKASGSAKTAIYREHGTEIRAEARRQGHAL